MGGGINSSRSPGEDKSAIGSESFSFRAAGVPWVSSQWGTGRCWFIMGALGEGILPEHLSLGWGWGCSRRKTWWSFPSFHGFPPEGKCWESCGAFLLGQERGLERGWCLLAVWWHRCVPGQVCAVEVGERGQGLLFGLTGRAAVINQSVLGRECGRDSADPGGAGVGVCRGVRSSLIPPHWCLSVCLMMLRVRRRRVLLPGECFPLAHGVCWKIFGEMQRSEMRGRALK